MKILLSILWLVWPLVPGFYFLSRAIGGPELWFSPDNLAWSVSMLSGIHACFNLPGQLLLASRPFGIGKIFGRPSLQKLHALSGVLGMLAILLHLTIKLFVLGYSPGLQTFFGFVTTQLVVLSALLAWLFIANGIPGSKAGWILGLRSRVKEKWGWTFKGMRAVHGLLAIAFVLLVAHVLLAGVAGAEPGFLIFLFCWFALALSAYGWYRLKDRQV